MESYLILTLATVAVMICVPLLVQMARKGFAWYARLYVALFAVSAMLICQSSISGVRVFGYLPEILIVGLVAIGCIIAFMLSTLGSEHRGERAGAFRSFF